MKFKGTPGNDSFTGTGNNDVFNLSAVGNDKAKGLAGNDVFNMGSALNARDTINGGAGNDTVNLDGDYAGLVFKGFTMTNVENLVLAAGHDYSITTVDNTVANGSTLNVNASALGAGGSLTFDGSAETNGSFSFKGGHGDDNLTGGALSDTFDLSLGGDDTAKGGDGNDSFDFGAKFTTGDRVNGGTGSNSVFLAGDYTGGVTLKAHMVFQVTDIQVQGRHDYAFTLDDHSLTSGQRLEFFSSALTSNHTLSINAANLTDGSIFVVGNNGADRIIGGSEADVLQGGHAADFLKGNGGADIYFYATAADSTGLHFDTIKGFDFQAGGDIFQSPKNITGTNSEVDGGTLTHANFNSDLEGLIGAAQLSANHAVIFKPGGTDYSGDTFLIVDFNGTPGYQAGQDVVVLLENAAHLSQISAANFQQDL